ncbi:ABC transporter substrate-binding protein [Leadbettera azotonutricia]|uniref:Extracellular ligand-binding receptor n=1 Tax=Leadbettera azotonutricia (strain ATCC BAA-888 / DSM 13862 / ZAS-9) TaxID=545695 RepID=F5YFY5_LEAAZ|nr:ABC transporter substrate-binding protein [Leadbettera azotonutricia]AEF80988.1 extracellular ligand-binding receptor [Leadbettera azotonutricia ZAS-9]
MKKVLIAGCLLLLSLSMVMAGGGSDQTIKIGLNIPLTGDSPKVGEGAKYASEIVQKELEAAGGLDVKGKKYKVQFVIVDNELKADSAVQAALRLVVQDQVLAVMGPCGSGRAIPAGQVNNENRTPMVSPWATNPAVTLNRPYVFRACILDPVQAPAAVNFAGSQFPQAKKTAILYNLDDDYSKTLAELFRDSWTKSNGSGSVVAFESFGQKDQDFSVQLTRIINAGADLLYLPDYYNHVALIIPQAKDLGWGNKPILGSDSWGSADLVSLSNGAVKGYYFTTHYAAAGAVGATKAFIDKYKAAYGYTPDDVAALSYDSIHIILQAIQTAGITGNLQTDRDGIKNAIATMKNFDGITGKMTFDANGDPEKPAVVVRVNDAGEFEYVTSM